MDVAIKNISQILSGILQNKGLLDEKALQRACNLAESEGINLDRAILQLALIEEVVLLPNLAQALQIPYVVDLDEVQVDHERLDALTSLYCATNIVCPVLTQSGAAYIVTKDPSNTDLAAEISFHLDETIPMAVATTRDIRNLLSEVVVTKNGDGKASSDEQREADILAARRGSADGPVIRFVSEKFNEAVALGASDIHYEAQENGLRIRYRVNGVLKNQLVDHELAMSSVLARVKVLAGMNVSERRLPQDGRIALNIAGRKVDFRVSSVPTSFGESIVCRILDPKALRLGWEKLGFNSELARRIVNIVEQPNGLFLVTGPTGSGKTTTLYTALSHLNQERRKILTVEDPIEYILPGIEQVQVHDEIGMTFATALRSFLRQDPNIIMVGEIRDQETAEIACRAALVGRMVLSTLHTNSPHDAVTRMVDLGVPQYIVREVLRGVLGQSLEITDNSRYLKAELVAS